MLEPRQLLSTITWNNTVAPTGGDWDIPLNWSPAQVPGAGDDAVINLASAGTVLLSSNQADGVQSLATNPNTTLTVSDGSLSLGAGNSTLGGPVNVGQGAALNVRAGGSVTIGVAQTITDDGTLTFGSGDSVSFATSSQETTQIVVNSGGVMNASSTSFTNTYTIDAYFSFNQIVINSGGELVATDSTFGKLSDQGGPVNQLMLNSGSRASLHFNVFSAQLAINSGANINISGNDFSGVGGNGVIATGVSTAQIPLEENYWAATDPTQIGTLILDHNDDATRPTVDFQTVWSSNIGTIATPAFATFSPSDQTVNLSATVSTTSGIPINGGTETFTIMNGTQVIGQTTAAASVVNGSVTAPFTLPGGTPLGQYEIVASYSGTSNYPASTDTSQVLVVDPGPATQLVMHVEPSATATAGQAFSTQPVIYEEDPSGDLETQDNTTIVTASLNFGAGPLQGTLTARVVGGVATFSNLFDQLAETISINFTSGNLTEATSDNIVVSPAAASKLVIAQQPPATTTAGQTFSPQPVVMEEDQYGNVVTGDSTHTVTAGRGSVGTTALQGSNLTITLSGGVATFTGLSYDRAETMNIGFTTNASGVSAAASSNIVVSPAAASQLVIEQQPSATATVGQPFSTQPVIYEEDQFNNLKKGDNSTLITAVLNSGSGPLAGTATATVSGGIASFANLSDSAAEAITLKFTSSTLASLPSNPIVVSPVAVGKMAIHLQPSSTATAGHAFTIQPVIYLEDSSGNLLTSDNTSVVTVSLASGNGALVGTKQVTVSGGVATFAGLSDNTAGVISLSFSGDGLTAGSSNNITVSPAAPFQLVIHTQPSSAATAGQPLATGPVVYEEDQYGNVETGENSTVITASLGSGNGPLRGTTIVTLSGGVAMFGGLSDNVAGIISLNFGGAGFTAGPSNNVFISPGPATQLVIQTPPYSSVTAGNPLTDPIVIDEEDQYDNIETGDNSTVVTASLSSGGGTLNGTKTATVAAGVASFNGLEDDKAGVLALQFAASGLPPVIAGPSTVAPATATRIVITQPPRGVISGTAFGLTVSAEDPYGNTDTSFNGPLTVALASGSSGKLSGTTTVTATDGVARFANLVDTTSGPASLEVTGGSLTSASSGTITVSPAAPAKLVIQTQPSQSATVGSPLATQPVIDEEDQYGNLLTGDNTTTITVYLGSGAGPLEGTLTADVTGGVATFSGIADRVAGTISLQFTGAGLTTIPSVPIVISPATATQLVIQTQPSGAATAGQPFATQPVVWEEDQFGNLETADNSTTLTASLASGSGPLKGSISTTLSGGVGTFANLAEDTAETMALKFSGGGLTSSSTSSIAVSAAPATQLVIVTAQPSTVTAGAGFGLVAEAEDQFGNVDHSFEGNVAVALADNPNGETLGGAAAAAAVGGVVSITGLTLNAPGGVYSLKISSGVLSPATTPITNVAPPIVIAGTPTATIAVAKTPKTKKRKSVFEGFTIHFNTQMSSSAVVSSNYQLDATTIKRGKKILTPVKFSVSIDPTGQVVTLLVKGENPFAKKGQLTIAASSPTGVSSLAGVFLNSNDISFTISANAKRVMLA